MKRTVFEEPEFELIRFAANDMVVTTSGPGDGPTTTEQEEVSGDDDD